MKAKYDDSLCDVIGESLSKKQLKMEALGKQYKATKTDDDKTIKELKERLTTTEDLLEKKVTKLKELEDNMRNYSGPSVVQTH